MLVALRVKRGVFAVSLAVLLLVGARVAGAHAASDAYLTLAFEPGASPASLDGRLDLPLSDLDVALVLPRDAAGAISAREVRSRRDAIFALAFAHVGIAADGSPCVETARDLEFTDHDDAVYVALLFRVACRGPADVVDVDYDLFLDQPGVEHRGLAKILDGAVPRSILFSRGFRHEHIVRAAPSVARQLGSAVRGGMTHIASGIDHLLFLIALLLPSVLRRDGATWRPVPRFRDAAIEVARIVTAFTVAHSLTLSLSALDVARLSPRIVEPAIAASVVFAALQNLTSSAGHGRWKVAFVLGLLHGFGFSSALVELALPRREFVLTLFGFNVGVEIGQLAVVAAFLPVAYACRTSRFYRPIALVAGSVAIAVVASVWFVQRLV